MKTKINHGLIVFLLFATFGARLSTAFAQGTAFTYQGRLNSGGSPASGSYDLTFTLYTTNVTGSATAGPVTNSATAVTNGLFTTTIDFGSSVFNGTKYWLEVGVRTNGNGSFTNLAPRQQLTPTPYAIYAETSGNVTNAAISAIQLQTAGGPSAGQMLVYNGSSLIWTNAPAASGGASSNAWSLAGNSGTTNGNYLGTTDNQPLEIRVGGVRAGLISPSNGIPNIVFGPAQNVISNTTAGASILGGINNTIGTSSSYSVIGGGQQNSITNNAGYSVIGGGNFNSIQSSANDSFLGGGYVNVIYPNAPYSVLAGGEQNNLLASLSFLGGGYNNYIYSGASWSVLVGGYQNIIYPGANESVIVGGAGNSIASSAGWSFLGGGGGNAVNGSGLYNTVGGGAGNNTFSTAHAFLGGGGFNNIVNGQYSTLVGGGQNVIQNPVYAFLGGGFLNTNSANYAFLGGGQLNTASGIWATIGGGYNNTASGLAATVPGGSTNVAGGSYSFAAGANAQATNSGAFVWADAEGTAFGSTRTNQFNVRANGGVRFVTGGAGLTVDGLPVLAGNISLTQLIAEVVTNNEPAVSLGSLTLGGNLNLPFPANISSGGFPLLYADNNQTTYLGINAGSGGNNNTAIGNAAFLLSSGSNNTAIGDGALILSSGSYNTANGSSALGGSSGSYNTGNGYNALDSNSGSYNTANGYFALINNNGSYNTANGYEALGGSSPFFPPTGGNNTADGAYALLKNSSGSNNVANGTSALSSNTSGSGNTALGSAALWQATASGNIGIGSGGGGNLTTGNNNIDIGNYGQSGDNGVIRIGTPGTQTGAYIAGSLFLDGSDPNNGLSYFSSGLAGVPGGAGPFLFGFEGGSLGTTDPNLVALSWDYNGNIWVSNNLSAAALTIRGGADSGSLFLNGSDPDNGLSYRSSGLTGVPGGAGPFLFGFNGGSLGTTDPKSVALSWDFNGNVWVSNNLSTATLTIRGGADLAEPFNITAGKNEVTQGAVVVIDDQNPGQLKLTDQPYDTRVAGVVSGANGINPGIQMHQQGLLEGGKNVALSGRVYVKADTSNGSIKPGDMLTTSSSPGRAMKVTDHAKAAGAILGKAMTGLTEGNGMVLVLVTLQ